MTSVDTILQAAEYLSPAEQLEIIQELSARLQRRYAQTTSAAVPLVRTRVAGLDRGTLWMSDDFDAELSEDFWAGDANEPTA